jgi:hypothetical protein
VEPILGTIAAVTQLLEQGGRGAAWLHSKLPEYHRFWQRFEKQLKNEHDVPWDAIKSACDLQPEFIALALRYMGGDDDARRQMEAHFEAITEPPSGGRQTKEEIVERVAEAARVAANEAVSSDRKAILANAQLVIATIHRGVETLQAQIGEVREGVTSIEESVDDLAGTLEELAEGQEDHSATLEDIKKVLEQGVEQQQNPSASETPAGPSEEQVEELIARAGESFAKHFDDALERQRQASEQSASPEPLLGQGRGLDVASQQDYLEQLREASPEDAARLEALVQENGVLRIALAIRNQELAAGSLDLLVTAGRIVAKDGFHQDAEQAYLQASHLDLEDWQRARQFVRAASMANLQGSRERFDRHLNEARQLCPGLPALAIAEARVSSDPGFMLTRLEDIASEDREEQALIHQTRAQAHLSLEDEESAQAEFDLARAASPDNVSVREFEAILPWLLAQRQIANGEQPDGGALLQAATRFRELAADARREQRPDEAGHLSARASEALMLAGEYDAAQRVLEGLHDPELLSPDAALAAGRAALIAQRPDLALKFVPATSVAGEARLIRADAQSSSADPQVRSEGLGVLAALLTSPDEAIRSQAAFARLVAAASDVEVEWDTQAAEIVKEVRPEAEVSLRAERAHTLGDATEAQRLLLPYAGRLQSLRRLRDYAASDGDWAAVADRSRELIRRGGADVRDRLALADAQQHLGHGPEALAAFLEIARDPSVEPAMREAAFGGAMQISGADRDYTAIRDLAREWHEALPESQDGVWNYAFGLARLQEHDEAYTVLIDAGAEPDTIDRATLFAEVLRSANVPKADALRRLVDLSDRFDRKVEALEVLLIATALEGEDEEEQAPPEAVERVQDAMAHFGDRFPESQAIRAFPAPQTPEEIEAFLKEMAGDQPALQQQANDAVRDGRAPVNALAAVSPYGVAETWLRLRALPLGFCLDALDQADLDAADDAVGGAAVFDSAALAVLSLLPEEARNRMTNALPGSLISNEALHDAGAQHLGGRKPAATTVQDAEGNVAIAPVAAEDHERRQEQLAYVLKVAKSLEARPAVGKGAEEELVRLYEEGQETPDLRAATASVLLAKRTGKTLYSDDRWMREFARHQGVPAFGSLALLKVLAQRGVIAAELLRESRLALAAKRGWGVALSREELIEEGAQAGYYLTPALTGGLNDRAAWRGRPAHTCEELAAFLGAVHEAQRERFQIWVHRVVDAGMSSVPEMHPSWISEVLLLMAWSYGGEQAALSDKTFQALIDEIKTLPLYLKTLGYDPLMGALNQLLTHMEEVSVPNRSQVFVLAIRRLRMGDQLRAMEHFVADFPRRPR